MPDYVVKVNGKVVELGDKAPASGDLVVEWPGRKGVWLSVNYAGKSIYNESGVFVYGPLPSKPGEYRIDINDSLPVRKKSWAGFMLDVVDASPASRWSGTIADNGEVMPNVELMRAAGFAGVREWLSFDAAGACSQSKIDRVNAYVAAGFDAMVVLTPKEAQAAVAFPSAAITSIKSRLDRRVVVNIFNEVNLPQYWPKGDRASAFQMAAQIASMLQAAGFKVGSPSFAYEHAPTLRDWYAQAKNAGHFPFDFTTCHAYVGAGPAAASSFEAILAAAASVGRPVICDEWGFNATWTPAAIAAALPAFRAALARHTVADAYFIFSKSGKQPHDSYAWMYDPATRTRREEIFRLFAAT